MCACVHVCVFVCVSMAAVCGLVCVPDVSLLCLIRCPTHPTTGKTSPSLPFLPIATCMCLYVCICARICTCICVYVCVCVFVCVSMAAVCVHVCLLCLLKCLLSAYMPLALSVEKADGAIIWLIYTEH